jgi:hypothetical protein
MKFECRPSFMLDQKDLQDHRRARRAPGSLGFPLTKASGDMIVIRYADDTVVGFQREHEARAFLDDLRE